jgi:hydroxyethylthiazole kinase-like uncharacterized protein yjeF
MVIGLRESSSGEFDETAAAHLAPLVESADAVLLGPGLSDDESLLKLTAQLLKSASKKTGFVFDAAAIKHLDEIPQLLRSFEGRLVITPHAGEMAGLKQIDRSKVERDPFAIAQQVAEELGATVALKGAETIIVSRSGAAHLCNEGNVGLATSGSGDVLAGALAGLLARGTPSHHAACWAVYVHALAGDALTHKIGSIGYLARELLDEIPRMMDKVGRD